MRNAAPTDVAEASAANTSSAELHQDVSRTLFLMSKVHRDLEGFVFIAVFNYF